jgi:hypothetical protein
LENHPCEEWEANNNEWILKRNPFKVSRCYIGFATEDHYEQYSMAKSNQYQNTVFTDYQNIPKTQAIDGTQALHFVATSEEWHATSNKCKIHTVIILCLCLSCGGKIEEEACGLGEFWHAKYYWMQEKVFDPLVQA